VRASRTRKGAHQYNEKESLEKGGDHRQLTKGRKKRNGNPEGEGLGNTRMKRKGLGGQRGKKLSLGQGREKKAPARLTLRRTIAKWGGVEGPGGRKEDGEKVGKRDDLHFTGKKMDCEPPPRKASLPTWEKKGKGS